MAKILSIFALIFLFLIWFFYDSNPYLTEMYVGKKGSGKTCTLAKLALKYNKKGWKVYTNVPDIAGTDFFDPTKLDAFKPSENSVLLLDEVGLLYDARSFRDFSMGLNVFYKYSRQYKSKVIMFSQAFTSDVDLKIRNLVDRMYLMTRIGKVVLYRPVIKKLGIVTKADGTGDLADVYSYGSILNWHFTYLPRYYGLFKTYNPPERELIESTHVDFNEVSAVYADSKKWLLYRFKLLLAAIKEKAVTWYQHIKNKTVAVLRQ